MIILVAIDREEPLCGTVNKPLLLLLLLLLL